MHEDSKYLHPLSEKVFPIQNEFIFNLKHQIIHSPVHKIVPIQESYILWSWEMISLDKKIVKWGMNQTFFFTSLR